MKQDESHWRTTAVEDFLRTVYELQHTNTPVSVALIGRRLHIKSPSVSDMIRRLGVGASASEHPHGFYPPTPLLEHHPYRGVRLTPSGEQIALQVIRRRRLLELYLVQRLGYSWDEVDAEAERLEHALSEQLTQRLATALGNPHTDPHGDLIPTENGNLPSCGEDTSLVDMAVGQQGVITRITDYSPDLLHYLGDLGLRPGAALRVMGRSPLGDTITVQVDSASSSCILGTFIADHLRLACASQLDEKDSVPMHIEMKTSVR